MTLHFDFVNDNANAMNRADYYSTMKVKKKPVFAGAFALLEDATFVTSSGEQHGKPGDIVIIAKDHAWPVSREYFAEHYEVIE